MRIKIRAVVVVLLLVSAIPLWSEIRSDQLAYSLGATETFIYGVGSTGGLFLSTDGGRSWASRSDGLPEKIVYPFDKDEPRRITSLNIDPIHPTRVAVSTAYGIFRSADSGGEWHSIPLSRPVRAADHITSAAVSPHDQDVVYAGTSFNGYYVSRDAGRTWSEGKESIPALYRGAGFYEEISEMAVSPSHPDRVYLAAGFGEDIFLTENGGLSWRALNYPGRESAGETQGLTFSEAADGWVLAVHGEKERWFFLERVEAWVRDNSMTSTGLGSLAKNKAALLRNRFSGGRTGIYVNPNRASGTGLADHLELLRSHGMDMIIVDMKDDSGRITYDTSLELPKEIGAVYERFALDELLDTAHEAGVYVVGRIVVFQDPKFYKYQGFSHAIWTDEEKPWANLIRVAGVDGKEETFQQREYWVDPHSEAVWQYNAMIAKELQDRGIDEIQFDYIRFPSDGDLSETVYRHKRSDMTKVDAIESFLRFAREIVAVPISTDLYGFNSWYRMGNWIGQNIDVVADYVDVISPMFYPSHFPSTFMNDQGFFDRAESIYLIGGTRAREIVEDRALVRPYVQAFLIGSERKFEEPEYAAYLSRQLDGVIDSGASGFALWNASNIYYMVTRPLTAYTKKRKGNLP
ncbi:MAG: hypothetical protein HN368_22105 [Spirochaetales bacterium]|jgi:hypothetical protein|nr:hypothetical protein [Spirochaetales bacterium]